MNQDEAKNFIIHHRIGWRTFQFQDQSLLNNERRVFRSLGDIREHEFNSIASYLDDYGDPKNANKSAVVVGPVVDDQTLEGTWRHLSCRLVRTNSQGQETQNGKHFTLVQELAKGFLTSLDYSEARLVMQHYTTGDGGTNADEGKWFTLEWRAFDPDLVDSVCEARVATATQTDVKYRRASIGVGEAATVDIDQTGKTFKIYAIDPEIQQDGTVTVRVAIGDTQYQLDGFSSWLGSRQSAETFYYRVPESLAQGIINAAQTRGADAIPTGYDNSLGLVNIRVSQLDMTGVSLSDVRIAENCDAVTDADFLWGTNDNTLLPIPGTVNAGETYQRSVEERGDGSYNIRLTKTTRQYRAEATNYTSEHGAYVDDVTTEWFGVTDQDLSAELDEQSGKLVRVREQKRDDCSSDISRVVSTPTAHDTSWFDAGNNKNGAIKVRIAIFQTEANAKIIADSVPPTGSWFTNASVTGPDAQFGLYTVRVVATASQTSFSLSVPYKSYNFTVSGKKRQWDRNDDGTRITRLLDVTYHYAGDTREVDIKNYFDGITNIEGVQITPNGTGEYFQGFGYVIGTPLPNWSADPGTEP